MHDGSHALIEAVAALVLTLGGATIVARSWRDRLRPLRVRPDASTPVEAFGHERWSVAVVALLSGSAAAIHLTAGPHHVATLGDLGLGFYWAALLHGGFAVTWLASARPSPLAWAGLALNAVLIGVWGWSRTIGIGLLPGGPEPVGLADVVALLVEVGVVAMLAPHVIGRRRRSPLRRAGLPATSAAVAIAGVAVLGTAIAVSDLGRELYDLDTSHPTHVIAP